MDDPLRQAEGRLQRYWNVDGLHEIGVALILALTALWVWASDLSDLPRWWKGGFSATFPIVICGGMFAERWVVKAIRRRMTYPRVGFAELRRPPRIAQVRSALVGALLAAMIAASAAARWELRQWGMAVIGILMGALLWQVGSQGGITRFRVIAALIAVLGISMAGTEWPFEMKLVVFFAVAAAAMAASGGITLWRFLHT